VSEFQFQIKVSGKAQPASLQFATKQELLRYHRSLPSRGKRSSRIVRDAIEFTRLAAKRWRYYSEAGEATESLAGLRQAIVENRHCEVAFILIATTSHKNHEWPVGLAYCRRTWCHHLALDFLALHPRTFDEQERVTGVGSGIVYCLVSLAKSLQIHRIWGEATVYSAPFYEKLLGQSPVLDLFEIESREMKAIQNRQAKTGR